jgi:hypothetical protein
MTVQACSGLTIRFLISGALALLGCATRPAPIQTSGCAGETSLTTPDQLDLFGAPTYFNNGKPVPAGRYLMTYVDGCMKYSGDQGWTVNAYPLGGPCQWWLIGDTAAAKILQPPGAIGYLVGEGAFADFDDCVRTSKASPPKVFDHPGGLLGVVLQDAPYQDNIPGPQGRNPKWRLDRQPTTWDQRECGTSRSP